MSSQRQNFNQRIALIMLVAVLSILVLFSYSLYSLREIVKEKDEIGLNYSEEILNVERLSDAAEQQISSSWGYLLFKNKKMLVQLDLAQDEFENYFQQLTQQMSSEQGKVFLREVKLAHKAYLRLFYQVLGQREQQELISIRPVFENQLLRKRFELKNKISQFKEYFRNRLDVIRNNSIRSANRAWKISLLLAALAGIIIPYICFLLYQALIKQQEADHAVRIREEVLAGVSHDLKNPLGTVLMSTTLLEKLTPRDEAGAKIKKLIDTIKKSSVKMNDIISNLLSISKLESGTFQPQKEIISAEPLITDLLEMMSAASMEKEIQIELKMEEDFILFADKTQILRVLLNLVGNAIKFSPHGEKVTLSVLHKEEFDTFIVEDNGLGISKEELPFVFERFWQAKKTAHKGSGIGLAICKGIISAHQGKIWVESSPGKGSRFIFTLPRKRD